MFSHLSNTQKKSLAPSQFDYCSHSSEYIGTLSQISENLRPYIHLNMHGTITYKRSINWYLPLALFTVVLGWLFLASDILFVICHPGVALRTLELLPFTRTLSVVKESCSIEKKTIFWTDFFPICFYFLSKLHPYKFSPSRPSHICRLYKVISKEVTKGQRSFYMKFEKCNVKGHAQSSRGTFLSTHSCYK